MIAKANTCINLETKIINLNTICENFVFFQINKSNIRLLIGLFLVKYRMTKQICFFHNSYLNLYICAYYLDIQFTIGYFYIFPRV